MFNEIKHDSKINETLSKRTTKTTWFDWISKISKLNETTNWNIVFLTRSKFSIYMILMFTNWRCSINHIYIIYFTFFCWKKNNFKKIQQFLLRFFFELYWREKSKFDISNTWNRWQRWFRNEQNFHSIWMIRNFLLFDKLKKLRKIRSHMKILRKNNTFEKKIRQFYDKIFNKSNDRKFTSTLKSKKFIFRLRIFESKKKSNRFRKNQWQISKLNTIFTNFLVKFYFSFEFSSSRRKKCSINFDVRNRFRIV